MSAIQELQPYCDAFQGRIREAKDSKGYTLQRLIDESGVPKSAVNNISAGKQVNPLLYNAAALCKVLDLSLDDLFGLEKPLTVLRGSNNAFMSWKSTTPGSPPLMSKRINGSKPPVLLSAFSLPCPRCCSWRS